MHDRIEEYLDGTLSPEESSAFTVHLETCGECREELGRCRRLLDLGRLLAEDSAPPELAARLRQRSLASRRRGWLRRPFARVAAAAAVLLLALVPTFVGRPDRPAEEPLRIAVAPPPAVHLLEDWLVQAGNADPADVLLLAEEARVLDLRGEVRSRLVFAVGAERDYLVAADDLLIQLENDPGAGALRAEAAVVAMGEAPVSRAVLPLLLLLLAATALAEGEQDEPRARFWEARRVMLKGDPATAAELFRVIQAGHPKVEVADDCLYWMGRCYLRQKDHEPDAIVALARLVKEYPESPFLDEAARELARLGDRSVVPGLKARLRKGGPSAEMVARALAEFGEEEALTWLTDHTGEAPRPPEKEARSELAELRETVRRLKKEVDEALELLRKLLRERGK